MAWIDKDYVLQLRAPLDDAQAKAVREIPGLRYAPMTRQGTSIIWAPLNAAWLLEKLGKEHGFSGRLNHPPCPRPSIRPVGTAALDMLTDKVRSSELRPGVFDRILFDYQRNAAARLVWTESGFVQHPPGAGKTLTSLVSATAEPGSILITTPAAVRNSWFRQIAQYTELDAHVIDPELYARKGSEKLDGYMDRAARLGLRPVVVCGVEALVGQLQGLLRYPWKTWICDESHTMKAGKRRKFLPPESEGARWIERTINNLSWAGEQVSLAVSRRLLLSATPIPDRTRDAWSQLDLCEPGSWGRTSTCFDFRYCDGKSNVGYPGINNKGISNEKELAQRWSFTRDRVPYSVTHALLPPRRLVVTKLPAERQDRPSGAGAQAIRDAIRKGTGNLQEARQLEAASRKRTYLLDTALSVLLSGGKVIVTTGLVADRARLAEDFQRKIKALDPDRLKGLGFYTFDGASHSPRARAAMREAYMGVQGPGGIWISRPHPGPALVVATTDVMCVGQDWQDTDHMLVGHIPWNHGEIWQLINRVTRPGQTRSVCIEIVAANGTADDHIVDTVLSKTVVLDVLSPDLALAGLKTSMEGLDDPEAIYASFDARMERRVSFNHEYSEGEDG